MSGTESRQGRAHDAEGARQAILDAAEEIFAQHGFDGARIDAIAETAGYNKSLIFQYYGSKLDLYAEVIRRADELTRGPQTQVFAALLEDETAFTAGRLIPLFKTYLSAYFDFLIGHPRFVRMLVWEMAEGWQTYTQVLTQRDVDDVDQFRPIQQKIQAAGVLRSNFRPIAQFVLIEFLFPCYLSMLPLYQALLPGEAISSPAELAHARDFIVDFVVHGMLLDATESKP